MAYSVFSSAENWVGGKVLPTVALSVALTVGLTVAEMDVHYHK